VCLRPAGRRRRERESVEAGAGWAEGGVESARREIDLRDVERGVGDAPVRGERAGEVEDVPDVASAKTGPSTPFAPGPGGLKVVSRVPVVLSSFASAAAEPPR
jgi:hypothetical protein